MRKIKTLIISILSLTLCVIVSFAWINELQNPAGRVMALRLTNASIGDSNLTVKLSEVLEEDNAEGNLKEESLSDITKLRNDVPEKKLETYDNFAPGSRKKFKLDITNNAETSVRLRLILSDIICDNEELRQNVVIGTNGFVGFDALYPAPVVLNERLSDGVDAAGNFMLVDLVEIPPKKPVSIYFYIQFTATGNADLEDMSFSIGTINLLTL